MTIATVRDHPLLRVLLCAGALTTLALCSASDAELDARLGEVSAAIDEERWDDAVAAARSLLEANPDDARVHARLGTALMRKARKEEKVLDEARAEAAGRANDPAAFFDPSLFRVQVTFDEELGAEAEQQFRAALERDESLLEAYLGLATIYAESGRFEEERDAVARAAKQAAAQPDAAGLLIRFGERHFQAGRYQQALDLLAPLQEAFPGDAAVALDHAAALFASGRYADGIGALETALAANPAHGNMRRTLGQMFLYRLEWKKAADVFAALAEEQPEDVRMMRLQQGAALMPIDGEGAKAALQQAIAEQRDQVAAVASNLIVALTEAEIGTDELVRLASQLNQAQFPQVAVAVSGFMLSRDPRSVPGHVMLGFTYDNMRYFDLALAQLDEAGDILRQDPERARTFSEVELAMHYGRVHFNSHDYEKAVDYLTRAKDPGSYGFILGLSYEELGKPAKAFAALNALVERGEPAQLAEAARRRLEREIYDPFRQGP